MHNPLPKLAVLSAALLCSAAPAAASFLDTDFYCQTYGCAVIYDSENYQIYDNYIFATGQCCVAFGQPMPTYYNLNQTFRTTGTTDAVDAKPSNGQGFGFDIVDGNQRRSRIDDGDGYLDASDTYSAFSLSNHTDLKLDTRGQSYSHSFWITSRDTRFSLRARAALGSASGDFANTLTLGDIQLGTNISTRGTDDGFSYGSDTRTNRITILSGIDDLSDLASSPTRLIHFGRAGGIRRRDGDLGEQTIRLDFNYTMPDYDMSMGIGELNIDVVFDLYREQSNNP